MKRVAIALAIVIVTLVVAWYARFLIVRVKQNNASVAMLMITDRLKEHARIRAEWPRAWDDLYPHGMDDREKWAASLVHINWQMTIEDITDSVEAVDLIHRDAIVPPEAGVPVLVDFTDRVPRDASLIRSERVWNWMTAVAIYNQQKVSTTK